MKEKTALIDADSLLYYEMGKSTLEEAIEGLDIRIHQIINFVGANNYAGFLTLSKCFRYDVAKTKPYKYNRRGGAPKPPIFYALKEYIQQQWGFYGVTGLEADDLVAIYQTKDTVICSPDKDVLKQLAGSHFNYGKMEYIQTSESEAYNFLLIQTLMGDSTDGIPGIPKVGIKTAQKWVNETPTLEMVLQKYQETFGIQEGIHKFAETFNLVYLLRSQSEIDIIVQSLGALTPSIVVPELRSRSLIMDQKLTTDDSDW